jgi:hypothetical protein
MRTSASFCLLCLSACAATGGDPRDGGPIDATAVTPDVGMEDPECAGDGDCPDGFVCAAVSGVPRCVPDPDPPPPGDGTDCRPCPSPGECRMDVCIQPTPSGMWCEFDDECMDDELCIAGRCTPDPRIPVPCTSDAECPAGLRCSDTGICTFTTDCALGLVCEGGMCTPGPGGDACVADEECPEDMVCDAGRCRPRTVCDIAHPSFAGTWDMRSILRIRDALPEWLSDFLEAVEGPFRFLSGDETCIDFGLPDWVETEICDLVRPFVEENLPPWSFPVFRAIADLNDVLSEWHIEERMELDEGAVTDAYRGTHEWLAITMFHDGEPIEGTPESILDWRFSPSPFNASAVCGTFHIERHDVNLSIGSIVAWIVDTLVYEASDHRWATAEEALTEIASGFCDTLAEVADESIDYDGVGDTVRSICLGALEELIDRAIEDILGARLGASPITLRGQASVVGPDTLGRPVPPDVPPGAWDGTMLGSEFPGTFCAVREGNPICEAAPVP